MTSDTAPDRIWLGDDLANILGKPKRPDGFNEYLNRKWLVKEIKVKMAELVDDTGFLRDASQQYAAMAEILLIIEDD